MCVVHHKMTLVLRSVTGFERVLLDRYPITKAIVDPLPAIPYRAH